MAIKVSGVTVIDDNRNVVNASVRSKQQDIGSISGAVSVNLNNGETILATIVGNTTFSFTNLTSGSTNTVYLYLTNPGAGTLTFPANTRFDKGNAPILYNPGNTLIILETYDNGANWIAVQAWRKNP